MSLEGLDKVRPYVATDSGVWQSSLAIVTTYHGLLWPGLEQSTIASAGCITPVVEGDIGN